MTTRVLLLPADPAQADALAAAVHERAPEVDLVAWQRTLDDAALADIDVVLGWRFPSGLAGRLPALRWVCSMAAGVDKLLVADLAPGVMVSRVVDPEQALGIAQYVALMALRHARALPLYEAQQQARAWHRAAATAAHPHVVVLGWGEIGQAVARALEALGFEVEGWRRSTGAPLPQVLGRGAIVVNALPLTAETAGRLDARAFAAMPRGAYLINVARGGHVVEADLIEAVRSGQLAGAALDVQAHEPLPADDPLWSVHGITITPHIAAQSSLDTVAEQFVAGLRCVQRGEPPPHRVDRARGY